MKIFPRENHSSNKPVRSPYNTLSDGGFIINSDEFLEIIGPDCTIEVILQNDTYPFAHEAGVYIPSTGEVFITSNQFFIDGQKHIKVSKFWKEGDGYRCEEINPDVLMGNGGVNYKDGVLFCAQGTFTNPGGLVYMEARPPYKTETIISNFHGRWFNSVNDVVIHSDGSIWFTDPTYAFEQGLRPRPQLPCQVYRYDPADKTGDIRAVADGFGKPNGLCFSPDEKTLYVTDTNAQRGEGLFQPDHASSMFAAPTTRPLLIPS